jgi:hypothetical protein
VLFKQGYVNVQLLPMMTKVASSEIKVSLVPAAEHQLTLDNRLR